LNQKQINIFLNKIERGLGAVPKKTQGAKESKSESSREPENQHQNVKQGTIANKKQQQQQQQQQTDEENKKLAILKEGGVKSNDSIRKDLREGKEDIVTDTKIKNKEIDHAKTQISKSEDTNATKFVAKHARENIEQIREDSKDVIGQEILKKIEREQQSKPNQTLESETWRQNLGKNLFKCSWHVARIPSLSI